MEFQQQGYRCWNKEYVIYLDKIIGKGNFGIVYECEPQFKNGVQEQLCAKVFINIIIDLERCKPLIQSSCKERKRDFKILKNVDNPNLVKVFYSTFHEKSSTLIIIMERCQSNLQMEIENKQKTNTKQFQLFEVISIFDQIFQGYQTIWENCIIHRDLKPENILIKQDGLKKIYKISDFGTGKICQLNQIDGSCIGTPVYSSPETNPDLKYDDDLFDSQEKLRLQQKQKIKNWKSQVDVYSLGIMAYQLLSGELPFQTKSKEQITEFQKTLKSQKIQFSQNAFRASAKQQFYLNFIERSVVYLPDQRITFEEILYQVSSKSLQEPSKLFQKSNPQQLPSKSDQTLIKSTQIQPSQNEIVQKPNFLPNRFNTKSFPPFQPNQIQFSSIIINTTNDFTFYLQQQILQNQGLFGKPTVLWLKQLILNYQGNQVEYFKSQKNELLEVFQFNGEIYSLEYLKFYYTLIYAIKKNSCQDQQIQFMNQQHLIQSINDLISQ